MFRIEANRSQQFCVGVWMVRFVRKSMHGLAVLSVNPQASGGAAEGGTEKERGNADAGRTATAARSRKAACHFAIAR